MHAKRCWRGAGACTSSTCEGRIVATCCGNSRLMSFSPRLRMALIARRCIRASVLTAEARTMATNAVEIISHGHCHAVPGSASIVATPPPQLFCSPPPIIYFVCLASCSLSSKAAASRGTLLCHTGRRQSTRSWARRPVLGVLMTRRFFLVPNGWRHTLYTDLLPFQRRLNAKPPFRQYKARCSAPGIGGVGLLPCRAVLVAECTHLAC